MPSRYHCALLSFATPLQDMIYSGHFSGIICIFFKMIQKILQYNSGDLQKSIMIPASGPRFSTHAAINKINIVLLQDATPWLRGAKKDTQRNKLSVLLYYYIFVEIFIENAFSLRTASPHAMAPYRNNFILLLPVHLRQYMKMTFIIINVTFLCPPGSPVKSVPGRRRDLENKEKKRQKDHAPGDSRKCLRSVFSRITGFCSVSPIRPENR